MDPQSSLKLLKEYCRIESVQPTPDYESCLRLLIGEAEAAGLEWQRHEVVEGKPILILTWRGREAVKPSLLLNSHMDVVPVFPEHWTHAPFKAVTDSDGNIFARGIQDMKGVGICHLEAVKRLKAKGKQLDRTIHLSFVPDEEIGGEDGMMSFVQTKAFKDLNVGFALDESLVSETEDSITLFPSERTAAGFTAYITGNPGHGMSFIKGSATVKAHKFITKVMDYREEQEGVLESNPDFEVGDVTTINWTMCRGGVQKNVLPAEVVLTFDLRITPRTPVKEVLNMVRGWADEIGDIRLEFETCATLPEAVPTSTSPDFPWFKTLKEVVEDKYGLKLDPVLCPGRTDACFLRQNGIAAYGFTPFTGTPRLLHDHNEFLNEKVFLKGIDIMEDVVEAMANMQ